MSWKDSNDRIGGNGGGAFSHYDETNGRVLKSIDVSAVYSCIHGIRVRLTGESKSTTFGSFDRGRIKSFVFEEGERISYLHLWGNGEGTRTGYISFGTNQNRLFDHGMQRSKGQRYDMDVHSGICMGVRGTSGEEIDSLAFVFLREVASLKLGSFTYPGLVAGTVPSSTARIITQSLQHMASTTNIAGEEEELLYWVFTGSTELLSESKWLMLSKSEGLLAHLTLSGVANPAKVPKVVASGPAGASTTFNWSDTGTTSGSSISTSTTTTAWFYTSGTLAPNHTLPKRTALIGQGINADLPFAASAQVTCSGFASHAFSFPVTGNYNGRSNTDVQITLN